MQHRPWLILSFSDKIKTFSFVGDSEWISNLHRVAVSKVCISDGLNNVLKDFPNQACISESRPSLLCKLFSISQTDISQTVPWNPLIFSAEPANSENTSRGQYGDSKHKYRVKHMCSLIHVISICISHCLVEWESTLLQMNFGENCGVL